MSFIISFEKLLKEIYGTLLALVCPCLLEALEEIKPPKRPVLKPLRMSVLKIEKIICFGELMLIIVYRIKI